MGLLKWYKIFKYSEDELYGPLMVAVKSSMHNLWKSKNLPQLL